MIKTSEPSPGLQAVYGLMYIRQKLNQNLKDGLITVAQYDEQMKIHTDTFRVKMSLHAPIDPEYRKEYEALGKSEEEMIELEILRRSL